MSVIAGMDFFTVEVLTWRGLATYVLFLIQLETRRVSLVGLTTLAQYGVRPLMLPPRSPNLNAFAERWVRSAKEECLAKLILFGAGSLRRALNEFAEHDDSERNHQGKENLLLFPRGASGDPCGGDIQCKQRLGGLLKHYTRAA